MATGDDEAFLRAFLSQLEPSREADPAAPADAAPGAAPPADGRADVQRTPDTAGDLDELSQIYPRLEEEPFEPAAESSTTPASSATVDDRDTDSEEAKPYQKLITLAGAMLIALRPRKRKADHAEAADPSESTVSLEEPSAEQAQSDAPHTGTAKKRARFFVALILVAMGFVAYRDYFMPASDPGEMLANGAPKASDTTVSADVSPWESPDSTESVYAPAEEAVPPLPEISTEPMLPQGDIAFPEPAAPAVMPVPSSDPAVPDSPAVAAPTPDMIETGDPNTSIISMPMDVGIPAGDLAAIGALEKIGKQLEGVASNVDSLSARLSAIEGQVAQNTLAVSKLEYERERNDELIKTLKTTRPAIEVEYVTTTTGCTYCAPIARLRYEGASYDVTDGDTFLDFVVSLIGDRVQLKNDKGQHSYFPK